MRFLFYLFILCSSSVFGQLTNELWSGIGIQRKLNSNLDVTLDVNSRIYRYDLQLIYPELTFKYKVNKWFKPSIDYRGLMEQNKYGNFHYTNRLNFNLNFEKSIKKMSFGFRFRYQYVFNGIVSTENYSPEFDQTIRLKPSFKYDIKKNRFSPTASIEWFYNPDYGQFGHQFSKVRASVGFDIDLPGPNTMSVNYLYGQNINMAKDKSQNIISIYYCYLWGEKREKKEK